MSKMNMENQWVGVGLDGTLAIYHTEYFEKYGPEYIGLPIPGMINKIQKALCEGNNIKIFTARVSERTACHLKTTVTDMEKAIHAWLIKHLGVDLEVTCEKDCFMIELWDGIRLIEMERNTGTIKNSVWS